MTKPVQFALNFRPQKPRELGSPKAAIADLYAEVGGVPEVMTRLGIGKSQAYAYTDPQSPEELSFARAAALTGANATAAAEYLAERAGAILCKLPRSTDGCPMTLTADAVREHGEAIAVALEAVNAQQPTAATRAKVRKEINEAICALAYLLGHFTGDER